VLKLNDRYKALSASICHWIRLRSLNQPLQASGVIANGAMQTERSLKPSVQVS